MVYVPLPYVFGDAYGPLPPWLDRLQFLRSDPQLIWRNQPNIDRVYLDVFSPVRFERDRIRLLRRFMPTVPADFRANHSWNIHLNSEGFRGDEFSARPRASALRIACIGDSWTFGMPVGQDETYPSRLLAWLRREDPGRRYDVLNFGVVGFSSFQGRSQIARARSEAGHSRRRFWNERWAVAGAATRTW
jgi:hypothetical protein